MRHGQFVDATDDGHEQGGRLPPAVHTALEHENEEEFLLVQWSSQSAQYILTRCVDWITYIMESDLTPI